jgi:hypothetical protein
MTKIAILGWGSLLWDESQREFDDQHEEWRFDGPVLKIEFSRISKSRENALTLVIDPIHGHECRVAYTLSRRSNAEAAISDLSAREGTSEQNIGSFSAGGAHCQGRDSTATNGIVAWARSKSIHVVLWTDLPGSFEKVPQGDFVDAAVNHLRRLPPAGKLKAAEYVRRAPSFVVTPLRKAVETVPWFPKLLSGAS